MAFSDLICKFNLNGHCKFGETCQQKHISETCYNFPCKLEICEKRHPKKCKFFVEFGMCKFGTYCSFLHKPTNHDIIFEEMATMKTEIETLKSEKRAILEQLNFVECKMKKIEVKVTENTNNFFDSKEKFKTLENKDNSKPSDGYPCEFCDFTGKSKAGLKTHVKAKHPSSTPCDKPSGHFNDNEILKEKESNATQEPFTCGGCEFNFKSNNSIDLLDHCRDVHGWFMCRNWLGGDGCEFQAETSKDLEDHMKNRCEFKEKGDQ